jgi:DNA polymerase (family 10)
MGNKKATAKANFEKTTLSEGIKIAEQLEKDLRKICTTVKTAGSIRQGKEMVGDIDIVVIPKDPDTFYDAVKELIDFEYGATKKIFGMYKTRPINIFVTTNESYGACLYQCTGPAIYNIHKRQMAKRKGFKLNEYGLFDRETNVQVAGHTEQSIFDYLEWDYREPNNRKAPSWIAKRNKVTDETSIKK